MWWLNLTKVKYQYFNEVSSTQDVLWAKIADYNTSLNPSSNTNSNILDFSKWEVVRAGGQSNGRGQFGRVWISEYADNYQDQNLYLSCLFIFPNSHLQHLRMRVMLSLQRSLYQFNIHVNNNDLTFLEKKVGGVLIEVTNNLHTPNYSWVILGIGLNVNNVRVKEVSMLLNRPLTSLREICLTVVDIVPLGQIIIKNLILDLRNTLLNI